MANKLVKKFLRSEGGSVIVETALMITVLLLFMMGIMDMGRALYVSNTLIYAARDGARFAAVHIDNSSLNSDTQAIVLARFNNYRFGGPALVSDSVKITQNRVGGVATAPLISVQVKINYPFNWLTPLPKLLKWTTSSSFTSVLHGQSEFRFEQ